MLLRLVGCKLERMCLYDATHQITWQDHIIRSISLVWIQCAAFSRPKNLESTGLKHLCCPSSRAMSVSYTSVDACCFFHWWKFSRCHLARVSFPSCLLAIPVLKVLLPPLFIVSNTIKHIFCCICITRITALSLVSMTLLTGVTQFWVTGQVKTEHFWSLKAFNSVVVLQF